MAEWTPANEPLQTAIQALTDHAAAPSTESAPSASRLPSKEAVPDARSDQAEPSPGSRQTTEPAASSGASPAPAESSSRLLDLNLATQDQLETLPGIGPSKAKAILSYRDQHNGFRSVDQLLEVKGIGPKVFERISVLVQAAARQ
ncbi:helix-hairpin-helix domain-containing protein [Cohnella cholangitidis]|uniref:Helix-hairpin-helix domain-containing protein n=1 Tax=Cohnella cholangitidis TaxID=2598458 RepID=A0A7G5BU37_9BACL|nr:helix-hairpin-helix domain-containing protein [Cohnella cholangitidis]